MKTILDDLGVDYDIGIDAAAFYGPTLDIQSKNVYGKEDTLVTTMLTRTVRRSFLTSFTELHLAALRELLPICLSISTAFFLCGSLLSR